MPAVDELIGDVAIGHGRVSVCAALGGRSLASNVLRLSSRRRRLGVRACARGRARVPVPVPRDHHSHTPHS
eukprot:3745378-Prymnesium_polylepis.1